MAAKLSWKATEDWTQSGTYIVLASPAGQYGFGTIGAANPGATLAEAWRMVQRAGMARIADRDSGRLIVRGPATHVEYALVPEAPLGRFGPRSYTTE